MLLQRIMRCLAYIICLYMAASGIAFSQTKDLNQNFNKVELASVYDGDTFRVYLACNYRVFCKSIPIRVRGVDCPEIKGGSAETKALAKQAKTFTKTFLQSGKNGSFLENSKRQKSG